MTLKDMYPAPAFALVFFISTCPPCTIFCLASNYSSVDTILQVHDCPTTRDDWMAASIRKNCSSIGSTNGLKLEYHCAINEWANATIEVCALNRIILFGKCSEYNHGAKRIQSSGMKICSNFTPPCPTVYNSSDAYMYQGCYDFSRTVQGNSEMTITFPPVPPTNQASGLETGIILVSIGLAVVVFVVGFAGIIRLYKKNRYNHSDECCENLNRNKHSCTNEESFPKGALL
ncbi:uncharacterized protein LOC125673265 isoform X2 [Ostrea edulis]|uniref:uncharacterized protein LOC125673265 isoform X2 n=1 Tax=Ostrea edulis TaxID=37623 RepID=UPI0024AF6F95|nr:uncharacterized protein LOC125673265 isoform X2 [Ostrea edulis]XP_056014324.1 uncharacterized protein LOC125673265 isoform X2 [Ostrea edulis]